MFSTKSKLKKRLIPRAVPTIFPHDSKRKAGDDNVLKEEAVNRVKVNILSGKVLIKVDDLEEPPSRLISHSAMTQTPASLSSQSPQKQKLRKTLKNIKKKIAARKVINTEKSSLLLILTKFVTNFYLEILQIL